MTKKDNRCRDKRGLYVRNLGWKLLPACELLRVNQTPDVECPVWTSDAIEAVERVCGDDGERSGWEPPKSDQTAT